MRITVGALRRIIREAGLDADMRNMAGSCDPSGANANVRDREAILNPPPGLGSPEEQEEVKGEDDVQRKSQPGARVADRAGPR